MHSDRGIVLTDIYSDGLSMKLDDPSTLTHQSAATKTPQGTLSTSPLQEVKPIEYVIGYLYSHKHTISTKFESGFG